jgi:predicted nucleic acid-binding protein
VRFVLDASTALSLILPDEIAGGAAKAVASAFASGDTALVPALWVLEITNALLVAERRQRIAVGAADTLLEKLLALPIQVEAKFPPDVGAALELLAVARTHQLTAYDGAYLYLARTRALAVASADMALVRAAGEASVRVLGN